ncbi:MAG: hypothetical protein M1822_003972 [Bathelium mastoideum]|nr:MAG: hypothetical protein M1822_003972 [Bathelium mastoideum]
MNPVTHLATELEKTGLKTKSRLLTLPKELRFRIYEFSFDQYFDGFLLSDEQEMELTGFHGYDRFYMNIPDDYEKHKVVPGLLGVCKQVRREAYDVFLKTTTFLYYQEIRNARDCASFQHNLLRRISRQFRPFELKDIRKMKIEIYVTCRNTDSELDGVRMRLRWSAQDGKGKATVDLDDDAHGEDLQEAFAKALRKVPHNNLIIKSIPSTAIFDLSHGHEMLNLAGQTGDCTLHELIDAAGKFGQSFLSYRRI